MAIVTHQNLEPPESEITKQAIAKKELAKLIAWEGVWDEAIAAWQIEPRAYGDAPSECIFCGSRLGESLRFVRNPAMSGTVITIVHRLSDQRTWRR
jgi:hypothetical protein